MITLNQISHLIKDRLNGGDSTIDVELDERDIALYVRQKMNEILKLSFFENMNMGDRNAVNAYIATYNKVAVSEDEDEKHRYCTLPENFLLLPHNKGIHRVSPTVQPEISVFRSNNPYVANDLPVGQMEGEPSYYHEGTRLIFRNQGFNRKWATMTIKLIIAAPETFGINDPLPLYMDHVSQIIEQSTRYFSPQLVQDTINDGNKDIGVNTDG